MRKLRVGEKAGERLFAMTVDVDGWSSLLSFYSVKHNPTKANLQMNIEDGIFELLELFREAEIKTTFFVAGCMVDQCSSALKAARSDGHEIGCHGLSHDKDEFLQKRTEQRSRIEQATRIIEQETGQKPRGFRAPCLRMNEDTLRSLEELGYIYDSSVVPTFIPGYYGTLSAPSKPYHPSLLKMEAEGCSRIIEIPISANPIFRIPLSGGWMRNLGSVWVKFGIRVNLALGNPVVIYVHPRDVLCLPKVRGVPWHLYRNVGKATLTMLADIIRYARKCGASLVKAIDLAHYHVADNDGVRPNVPSHRSIEGQLH